MSCGMTRRLLWNKADLKRLHCAETAPELFHLGCGTGRTATATAALLSDPSDGDVHVEVSYGRVNALCRSK